MHAPGDRREGACTRAETNGKSVRAQGVLARDPTSRLALPLGTSPCQLRDPLRRPGLNVERRGKAGAEDLRGPGLRLRVSYTFSRVKDRALPPALPCLHV